MRGSANWLGFTFGLLPLVQRVSLLAFTSYENTSPAERAELMWNATSLDLGRHSRPPITPLTSGGRGSSFHVARSMKRSTSAPFSFVVEGMRLGSEEISVSSTS